MNHFNSSGAFVFTVGILAFPVGCLEHSADLGNGPSYDPIYAESSPPDTLANTKLPINAPWKLVEHESNIFAFAVDQGQAFWLHSLDTAHVRETRALHHCDVSGCKRTLQQFDAWDMPNGSIHTSELIVITADLVIVRQPTGKLIACSRVSGADKTVLWDADPSDNNQMVFVGVLGSEKESIIFRSKDSLNFCRTPDCNGTLVRLPGVANIGTWMVTPIVMDSEFAYAGGDGIYRLKLDGTTNWELIAPKVERVASLALHGDSIYWTEPVTLGTVKTCPKTGCVGTPAVVVPNLNRPGDLIVDDKYVYVMEPAFRLDTDYGDRILRCPIGGCDEPTVLAENVGGMSGFSQDQSYIYFSGAENYCFDSQGVNQCQLQPSGTVSLRENSFYIAAIPK